MQRVVIIGNGIAGTTAARHIRKLSDRPITIISDETDHFYSRTALMYIYMGHMTFENTKPYEDWFWKKNNLELVRGRALNIDTANKSIELQNGKTIEYGKLIIATGSKPNKFGWPGQNLHGVQGLYHYQDLEALESMSDQIKHGVIVGGGLIGIELAEMLRSRGKKVTMLVREDEYWSNVLPVEEAHMISQHIRDHHIDLKLSTELREIKDKNGSVHSVVTSTGEEIPCEFVGLTAGVSPNIDFLKDSNISIEVNRGILVDQYLETSSPDIYAIGDCAELRCPPTGRRALEPVWYVGKIMGEFVAANICDRKLVYDPGVWFNSAKFLDIEYQTYGDVPPVTPDSHESFYWQHQSENIALRFNFLKDTGTVTGCNAFGTRLRHNVCEHWLKNKTPITQVVSELPAANFDPEFYQLFEQDFAKCFNEKFKSNQARPKIKRGLFSKFFRQHGNQI